MKKIILSFVISLLIYTANPALAQFRSDKELSYQRLLDRMERLEKDLNIVQEEVYRGTSTGATNTKKSKKELKNYPKVEAQVMALEEEIRNLSGRIEEAEYTMNSLAEKLDKIIADIDYRINSVERLTQNTTNDKTQTNLPAPGIANSSTPIELEPAAGQTEEKEGVKTASLNDINTTSELSNDPSAQYEHAFSLLRKAKYDEAEKALKTFIESNPSNSLLGNAYYWLGETYYVRDKYEQAAINFLKGYKDFPEGNKVTDNLLKLAMSLSKLEKKQEACTTFDKLLKEFPKADKDITSKVSSEKESLGC